MQNCSPRWLYAILLTSSSHQSSSISTRTNFTLRISRDIVTKFTNAIWTGSVFGYRPSRTRIPIREDNIPGGNDFAAIREATPYLSYSGVPADCERWNGIRKTQASELRRHRRPARNSRKRSHISSKTQEPIDLLFRFH